MANRSCCLQRWRQSVQGRHRHRRSAQRQPALVRQELSSQSPRRQSVGKRRLCSRWMRRQRRPLARPRCQTPRQIQSVGWQPLTRLPALARSANRSRLRTQARQPRSTHFGTARAIARRLVPRRRSRSPGISTSWSFALLAPRWARSNAPNVSRPRRNGLVRLCNGWLRTRITAPSRASRARNADQRMPDSAASSGLRSRSHGQELRRRWRRSIRNRARSATRSAPR